MEVTAGYESLAGLLGTRKPPLFTSKTEEYVAKFEDVEPWMQSGDGMWFSGVAPHSFVIRIATVSNVSHAGVVYRAEGVEHFVMRDGSRFKPKPGEICLLHMIEGKGCMAESFHGAVRQYPGQYYWGPADVKKWPAFDRDEAAAYMRALVGVPYGTLSVGYEALWHIPLIRECIYWWRHNDINTAFDVHKRPPYCSDAQTLATEAGGQDPVPERAHQLTTPQDTFQSLFWGMKVALKP